MVPAWYVCLALPASCSAYYKFEGEKRVVNLFVVYCLWFIGT